MVMYEPFVEEVKQENKSWDKFNLFCLVLLLMVCSFFAGYFTCWSQQPFEIKYVYNVSKQVQEQVERLESKHGREKTFALLSDRLGFYFIDGKDRRISFKVSRRKDDGKGKG